MSVTPSIVWHKGLSLWYEWRLRLDTRGAAAAPTHEGARYTPLPYPMIFQMLRTLQLGRDDVFVDIGCGKGRVVCCAARLPIKKVVALELNRALLEHAERNAARLRGRIARVEPVHLSADEYAFPDATVAYLYNPFNERLTARVVDRLFESYTARPRTMRIVYANPVHEDVLDATDWLEKYGEWPATAYPVFGCRVSFWRSRAVTPDLARPAVTPPPGVVE